jgi:hypothetical protein
VVLRQFVPRLTRAIPAKFLAPKLPLG